MTQPGDLSGDMKEEQFKIWCGQRSLSKSACSEPELEESTIEVIKFLCDTLKQTDEVFIMSVHVIEEYVRTRNERNEPPPPPPDSLLTVMSGVLITSKLMGARPDVKLRWLQTLCRKLSRREVDEEEIKNAELRIIVTLKWLPVNFAVSDLSTFLEYFIGKLRLRVHIYPLCLEILSMIYICRKQVHYKIKEIYRESEEAKTVFQHLISNKMYIPSGIMLCALKITRYKNFLDLEKILSDIEDMSSIHCDHLNLLAGIIYELLKI